MGVPDGAHTHGSGGSGLGMVVLVIVPTALLGPAVAAAVAELLHLLVIVAVVLAAVAGAGGLALVAFRVSRERQDTARVLYRITPAPARTPHALPEPRPNAAALPPPAAEIHHHWHGVSPEDVAAILRRQNQP